jgi:hypothetical protein
MVRCNMRRSEAVARAGGEDDLFRVDEKGLEAFTMILVKIRR